MGYSGGPSLVTRALKSKELSQEAGAIWQKEVSE